MDGGLLQVVFFAGARNADTLDGNEAYFLWLAI